MALPSRRLTLLALVVPGAALLAGSTGPATAAAPVPIIVIEGKGHGHGVGMPQDGALAMGKAGKSVEEILATFFPGTSLKGASGTVRVQVADAAPTARFVLAFPRGGSIQGGGSALTVAPGGRVAVGFDGGRYIADPLGRTQGADPAGSVAAAQIGGPVEATTTTEVASTTTTASPSPPPAPAEPTPAPTSDLGSAPLRASAGDDVVVVEARGRQYRGVMEVRSDAGRLRLVNEVDVEQYLRGMGEVRNPSWPAAGLEAQAIAARTYALRAAGGGRRPGGFHLFDDQRSQVYLGRQAEYAAMDAAVARTRGKVVTYSGSLAATVYSSSAGGVTATAREGFGPGASDRPYLKAITYQTADPRAWRVEIATRDVATRLGYRGTVSGVRVASKGPSGRALTVVVEGTAGPLEVSGVSFDAKLGLKSTLFTVRGDTAATAPAPPAPAEPVPFQELFDADSVIVNDSGVLALLGIDDPPSSPAPDPARTTLATEHDGGSGILGRALVLTLVVFSSLAFAWIVAVWRSPFAATLGSRARRSAGDKLRRVKGSAPDHRV